MLIYNTLGRKKEEFVPAQAGKANMYVCGITAYDLCHIGHARSALVFDVLVRQLRHTGLEDHLPHQHRRHQLAQHDEHGHQQQAAGPQATRSMRNGMGCGSGCVHGLPTLAGAAPSGTNT